MNPLGPHSGKEEGMSRRRIHYTDYETAIEFFTAQCVLQEWGGCASGLWYAFEDDYINQLKANHPSLELDYSTKYEVDISECNMLVLDTRDKVFEFTAEYRYSPSPGVDKDFDSFARVKDREDLGCIDWVRVAKEYDGIELNPYFDDIRKEAALFWYYAHGIISGCIWNWDKVAIKKIRG